MSNHDLGRIHPDEKDYSLLHPRWATKPTRFEQTYADTVSENTAYLSREFDWLLSAKQSSAGAPSFRERMPAKNIKLSEAIVRFPSAPIYSIHRKRDYHFKMPERVNYHTMRVLRRPWYRNDSPSRISRSYLLHNGLNEN